MPGRPRKLTTSGVDRGRPLDEFLAERLAITAGAARDLVRRGSVYLGRRRVEDPAHPLDAGLRVTVHGGAPPPAAPPANPHTTLRAAAASPGGRAATLGPAPQPSAPVADATDPAASREAGGGAGAGTGGEDTGGAGAPAGGAGSAARDGAGAATGGADSEVREGAGAATGGADSELREGAEAAAGRADGEVRGAASAASPVADWVVYRDDEVIVIDKPPGVPSQATRESSAGALDRLVTEQLDRSARLLHRIDRGASGLVLFTRTAAAHRRFADLLAARSLERTYAAVVWGHWPSAHGELAGPIGRDPADHRRRMVTGSGRPARTRFRLLRRGATLLGQPVSLLELDLVTGRTHQIRVHLAHAGHPICGDGLYGAEQPPLARLHLHARRLAWPGAAPVEAPLPPALSDLIG